MNQSYISTETVIRVVGSYLAIEPTEITGKARYKNIAHARHVAMYFARKVATDGGQEVSYPSLGRAFGFRDHTTVMSAVTKIEKLIVASPRVRKQIAEINERLKVILGNVAGSAPIETAIASAFGETFAAVGT